MFGMHFNGNPANEISFDTAMHVFQVMLTLARINRRAELSVCSYFELNVFLFTLYLVLRRGNLAD